jgi:hypothetical protein
MWTKRKSMSKRRKKKKAKKEAIKLTACRIKKIDHQQYCQSAIVWRR